MTADQTEPITFDQHRAETYDDQFAEIAPIKTALNLLIQVAWSDLPDDARILCVGAGTGNELLALARVNPTWRFTALDPSEPMLDICRTRMAAEGFADRCTTHTGKLPTLPESEPFDAATALLVSHFITDREDRCRFFRAIAARLKPGGRLVNADISADLNAADYPNRLALWRKMLAHTNIAPDEVDKMTSVLGEQVAVVPPAEIAALLEASGLEEPTLFYQSVLIHAWLSRKPV